MSYLDFETKVILLHTEISKLFGTDKFVLAGGALRDIAIKSLINDYDCFVDNEDNYNSIIKNLTDVGANKVKERRNSTVFELKGKIYDVIRVVDKTVNDIVYGFDFHCCCAGYDGKKLVKSRYFLGDCEKRKIRIFSISLPYHSISRVSKLKKQGFTIDTETELQLLDYAYKANWGPGKEAEYNDG